MTNIKKNKTAEIPTKSGNKYSYTYADIAQVNEYLAEKGIEYYQYTDTFNDVDYIMTVPIINGEEKPPRRGCRIVDAELRGVSNPVQEYGSALTYCRRYSLYMAFGLATEDDDASSLSVPKEERKATENQVALIKKLYDEENQKKIIDYYKVEKLEDLAMSQASEVIGKKKNG